MATPWDEGFDVGCDELWDVGYENLRSGQRHGRLGENPYLPGTTDHEDWIAGFYAGLSSEEEEDGS